ncbi:PaaI family thioesterase [Phaeobacter sp. QD34_3]|uniref:PaaI family thioesterase n=1 Tax=unclassified Phaeobacter TaxID=2621772 RepID=UPI00237FD3C1|nr:MULTISPECIES: PaaI family thioesterase [unclassified Phaeobacter]MDE4131644.1 PaaI family thioesterase [Phaeobacter sp. QD34_3]MDE4135267.1 PaaI family thioesterase [Phaeobacter sp. QD34_24]
MGLAFDAAGLSAYMAEIFPQVADDFAVDELSEAGITMRLLTAERHLRPGGTVSGPSMFALADVTVYGLVLSRLGRKALAVTTNCSLDFMRKPEAGVDLVAKGTLLKLGRSLAVGDVHMFSAGSDKMVARSTMTYSIPPEK